MYLLEELNKIGTTVVVATHNESLMRRFGHPRFHIEDGILTGPDSTPYKPIGKTA